MGLVDSFSNEADALLAEKFLTDGYIVAKAENSEGIEELRNTVVSHACALLDCEIPDEPETFLNSIHAHVSIEKLNDFRMAIYQLMNAESWFRPTYHSLGKSVLDNLVGNELAMQNRINFSLQLPNDDSSLLGIHSDSFSGETPFQVVQWVPLVNVYDTKAMFLLPPEINRQVFPELKEIVEQDGFDGLFKSVEKHLKWIEVPFGSVLIFSPNVLHGNVINLTSETRWSMNARFTGLFTPYSCSEKGLGTFYLPITTKPVSRIGMSYRPPLGFRQENAE